MAELTSLVRRGAVVVNELPPAYAAKKGLMVDGSPMKKEVPKKPVAEAKPALHKLSEPKKKS
jgi:hypothetical protein